MSRMALIAVALVASMASASFAIDPYAGYNVGSGAMYLGKYDSFAAPTPNGMRFGDAPQITDVPNTNDAYIANGYNGQTCCGGLGGGGNCLWCSNLCVDWKLVSWYATWGHHGDNPNWYCGHAGCRNRRSCQPCNCQ